MTILIPQDYAFLKKYELSTATLYETFASVLPESKNNRVAFGMAKEHRKRIKMLIQPTQKTERLISG